MFSIAIYDKRNNDFYLIRDRLGIKPLHYFKYKNTLIFASEINSLTSLPIFKKEINFEAISTYLSFRYPTEDESSFFLGIKRLPAGSYIKLDSSSEKIFSYWEIPLPTSEKKHNEEKIISIIQKTWGKMSEYGHSEALKLEFSDEMFTLINKAL